MNLHMAGSPQGGIDSYADLCSLGVSNIAMDWRIAIVRECGHKTDDF
jgi:hypothetical protein